MHSDNFTLPVFSGVTQCSLKTIADVSAEPVSCIFPEDGGNIFLQNVGTYPSDFMVSHIRRQKADFQS
jgi:hypothetical protein